MIKSLEKSSRVIVYACGILLFACAFFTATEVILRKFFSYSFGGVDEISSYVLAFCFSWSIAYVLFEKMHIRIEVIYVLVSKKIQYIFDFIAMFCTLCFVLIITYFSFVVFFTSFTKSSVSNTPLGVLLWIPQGLWSLGFLYFFVVILILFFKIYQNIFTNEKNDLSTIKKEY
jgi:TRAP-type mannitol/chloroaromatic compound transport system permease small subunit